MPRFAALRAALLPSSRLADAGQLRQTLAQGGAALEAAILRHQLGPLWHARTRTEAFAKGRTHAAMLYMQQVAAQRQIDAVLSSANIAYAIFKGAGTRDLIYDDPSLRVCYDIDVLVSPDTRAAAARALLAAGFRLYVDPSVASHEVVLSRDTVAIDLHWDLLRPGRVPPASTAALLTRRHRQADWWTLSDTDALFVMLVHPAFSKHLSTSQMGLHRVADVALWLQQRHVDWPALIAQLEAAGLKTAAWTMLTLVCLLSPSEFDPSITRALRALRPGAIRTAYLTAWLNLDLSARFKHLHAARLFGLSMMLHDHPSGAWRAFRGWQRSRHTRDTDALVFEGLAQ